MPTSPFRAEKTIGALFARGHLRFKLTDRSTNTLLRVNRVTYNVREGILEKMPEVVKAWNDTFNIYLPQVIRGALRSRTKEMEQTTRLIQKGTGKTQTSIWWHFTIDPGRGNFGKKIAQEVGRNNQQGTARKKYLVPLVTWMEKNNLLDKGVTSKRMREDLSKGFFRIKVKTKAGPAEMYLRKKPAEERKARARQKIRVLTKGETKQRRPRRPLREIADAMYLAYDAPTGIYGESHPEYTRITGGGKPRPLKGGDFAGTFRVNTQRNAPRWFSRAQVRFLGDLYRSLLNPRNITFDIYTRARTGYDDWAVEVDVSQAVRSARRPGAE